MDEQRYDQYDHPWDDGVYGTGPTQPPKSHSGVIALLLILVIFLMGIVTFLGVMNIRMVRQLKANENDMLSVSFIEEVTQPTMGMIAETEPMEVAIFPEESLDQASMSIRETPDSVPNFPQEGGLSLQEIYSSCIPSVVSISCSYSTGTGVIVNEEGYIVTNAHVVENTHTVTVQLTDNRSFDAVVIGMDKVSDLAVLHIDAEDLIPAEFGDSSRLRIGDAVVAIGDPLGVELRGTYTNGIISGINRDVAVDGRTMTLIQTNAALNSGNSGGPLINCYGQVIGINTMKIGAFTDSAGVEGLGFAIPSTTVKDIVDQLIFQGYVSGRPTLGIEGEALPSLYQYYYNLPAGLYINRVDPSSDAAHYGITTGDILLGIDGQRVSTMDELNNILWLHEVGDTVSVTIYRSGKRATIDLTLTENKGS